MVAEIYGGISAFKTAFDIAKGLKDIDDATRRNAAVIELQEQILGAQAAQTTLIQTVDDLKKKVAAFEAWETKTERYQLHQWETGTFSYRLKDNVQPAEPSHHICSRCYEERKRFILNSDDDAYHHRLKCPGCQTVIRIGSHDRLARGMEAFSRGY